MTLLEVLEPLSVDDFVAEYMGRRYLLIRGRTGRYANVLPWTDVNGALRHVRPHGRVGLVQAGKHVPLEAIVSSKNYETAALDARKVEKLLASGASLVVTQIDELCDGVQELAESCEELFRMSVGVNMYAGWRTDHAFDLHWDGHDTLILQVSGRKRWKVYEPTVLHPIGGGSDKPPRPNAEPVWEGVLEDGDLLYMPRGWWHMAFPLDAPTLHLTVGWQHRTGVDLLKWAAEEAKQEVSVRRDLPHLESTECQRAYAKELREAIMKVLSDHVVERFMRVIDANMTVRPRLTLPLSATSANQAVEPDTLLRITHGNRLHLDSTGDARTLQFKAGQGVWSCDAALAPAFSLLRAARATTLKQMWAVVDPAIHNQLHALVVAMVSSGEIWTESPNRADGRAERQPESTKVVGATI